MLQGRAESIWIASRPWRRYPALTGALEVDVAVIGGGITGVTAAVLLSRAGRRVALLEARRLAEGATGGTTAHLTEALDARYRVLVRRFGLEGARLAAASARAANERIAAFVAEGAIECGFERVPGYLYTERREDIAEVEDEAEAARLAGAHAVLTWEVPLPFRVRRALRFENQAQFHVRDYLLPLAAEVVARGGHVFEGTRALDALDGEPCVVHTEGGTVRAQHVIVATNAPMNNRVMLQSKLASYRSYVVAVRPAVPPPRGLFWDTEDPYHYARAAHVRGRDYLLVGGEDHKTGQEAHTDARYAALLDYVRARYDTSAVDYHWSAQVVETLDGLPYIGRNSFDTRVYVATGYAGNGMTFGTLAAMILSDTVLGRDNPFSELYTATRVKPFASAREFFAENVDYPAYLIGDRLRGPEAHSPKDIRPGEGRVIEYRGERVAVYRDERGALHAVSAVCTHMGCQVHFNEAEQTWDCPCHGSRYDVKGKVLNGPAVRALAPREVGGPKAPRAARVPHEGGEAAQ